MNQRETAEVLAMFHMAWPSVEMRPEMPVMWSEMLGDIAGEDAMTAAHKLVRTSKWFPAISEFLETAKLAERDRTEVVTRALPSPGRTEAEREHARKCLAEARRLIRENAWKPERPVKGFKTLGESMGEMLRSVPVDDGWIEDARALSPTGRPLRPDDAA